MKGGAELFCPRNEDTVKILPRRVVQGRVGKRVGDPLGSFGLVVLVGDESAVVLPVRVERGEELALVTTLGAHKFSYSPDRETLGEGAELGELVVNSPALYEATRVGEEAEVVSVGLEFARLFEHVDLVSLKSTLDGCSESANAGANDDDLDAGGSARRRARVVGEGRVGLGRHGRGFWMRRECLVEEEERRRREGGKGGGMQLGPTSRA